MTLVALVFLGGMLTPTLALAFDGFFSVSSMELFRAARRSKDAMNLGGAVPPFN